MTHSSEAATKMAEIEGRDAEYVDPLPERLNYGTGGVCLHDRRHLLQVVRELQARLAEAERRENQARCIRCGCAAFIIDNQFAAEPAPQQSGEK